MLSEKLSWSENVEQWVENVHQHDQYFTYAENIHSDDCLIPALDMPWKTTRMPVVMHVWDNHLEGRHHPWTTVMTWNAFKGPLVYQGHEYKSKGAEFDKFRKLPRLVDDRFCVAVGGINAPLHDLEKEGWKVIDGPRATLTPEQYRKFILQSCGEFSTAKHVYVAMKTGWFSCRSVCYLACGRPVVVQDTGFSNIISTDKGLLPFNSMEQAVANLQRVKENYLDHALAAKEVAREFFDSDKVLTKLLDDIYASKEGGI